MEKILGRKREKLSGGGKSLGGKGGKGSQREKLSGGNAFRRERGKGSQQGKSRERS